jgi:hypothetical protein
MFEKATKNTNDIVVMKKAIEDKIKVVTDLLVKSTEKCEEAEKWLTDVKEYIADAASQEVVRMLEIEAASASAFRDASRAEEARLAAELSALKASEKHEGAVEEHQGSKDEHEGAEEEHEGAKAEHEGAKAEHKGAKAAQVGATEQADISTKQASVAKAAQVGATEQADISTKQASVAKAAQVGATEQADIATKQAGVAAHAVIMADKARADAAVDAECRELRMTLGKVNAAQCEEDDLQAKLLVVASKLARRVERAARQLGALKKLPNGAALIEAVKASCKTSASPVFDKKSGSFFSPN